MGTQILRPQDCFVERIRVSPCRRRNYHAYPPHITPHSYNSNPRFHRKPALPSDIRKHRQHPHPSISKRFASADDLKGPPASHHNHGNGSGSGHNFVVEKVMILRRGESLDSVIKSSGTPGEYDLVGTGTGRLGPDPEMVSKRTRVVDLRSPVEGKCDVYAGSAFAVSPAPSSLPLPSFSKKKHISIDDSATRDLRRLLRLDF